MSRVDHYRVRIVEAGMWVFAYSPDDSVVVAHDPGLAKRFGSMGEAQAYWQQQSALRPSVNGRPNRPLADKLRCEVEGVTIEGEIIERG